jgi:hypothetical protein
LKNPFQKRNEAKIIIKGARQNNLKEQLLANIRKKGLLKKLKKNNFCFLN